MIPLKSLGVCNSVVSYFIFFITFVVFSQKESSQLIDSPIGVRRVAIRDFGITCGLFERTHPARFPFGREVSQFHGDSGTEARVPSGAFVTRTPRRLTLPCRHRHLPVPRPQTGVTPPEPRRACNENFAEELTRSRDAYIKGETMLRESRTSSYRQVGSIEREANNTDGNVHLFILRVKELPRSDEEGYKETHIHVFNPVHLL